MRAHTKISVYCNGFVSGVLPPPSAQHFCRHSYERRIGRQAPVKRCQARSSFRCKPNLNCIKVQPSWNNVAGLAPRLSFETARCPRAEAPDPITRLRRNFYHRQLLQLPPAAWFFRPQQMPLARVHSFDLPAGGNLKTLSRAAMGLQFLFRIRRIPGHSVTSSRLFPPARSRLAIA
jgi:hypothetical protein